MRVLRARTLGCQPDQRYEAANCLKATSARKSARGFGLEGDGQSGCNSAAIGID